MKTHVYVDGFNLYYGCLHRTPYKWLDVVSLVSRIVAVQSPTSSIEKLHYFTADVPAKYSPTGEAANISQAEYFKALKHGSTIPIEIHKGKFVAEKVYALKDQDPVDFEDKVPIIKTEEKMTDVAMGILPYREVTKDSELRHIIYVTNDSDLIPSLKSIREDYIHITVGLINPKGNINARPSRELSKYSHWTRSYISEEELIAAQFKERFGFQTRNRSKVCQKPKNW